MTSVLGLVRVEIRRLLARRITRVTALLLLVMVALVALGVVMATFAFGGYEDFDEAGFDDPGPAFEDLGPGAILLASFGTIFAAYIVGASFIAAEFASGALATWLTFIPSRLAVFASKLVAVLIGSIVTGVLGISLTLGVCALVVVANGGSLDGIDSSVVAGSRALVIVAIAGIAGYCVASVTRNTGIAIGLVLGYLILAYVFNFVMVIAPELQVLQPWLPEHNVLAVINDGTTYLVTDPDAGRSRDYEDMLPVVLSFPQAIAYWVAVVAATVTVAGLLFRRRDVV